MKTLSAWVVVVLLACAGCGGSDEGGADARAVDAPAVVDAAAGADGALTDAAVPACPADPPSGGSACTAPGLECAWLRCDTVGYVEASCSGAAYVVTDEFCSELLGCGDGVCGATQLCYTLAGGALLEDCRDNPCGTGPIEASCACADLGCAGGCTVSGRNVHCNTCPPGPPCP